MRRIGLVALLLLGSGCGGAASNAAAIDRCLDNAATVSLVVTPQALNRGEAVDIQIVWTVYAELAAPVVATLVTGSNDDIEVDVSLIEDIQVSTYPTYYGTQLNPFGLGVPAGSAAVLVSAGSAAGCDTSPTATASFDLL